MKLWGKSGFLPYFAFCTLIRCSRRFKVRLDEYGSNPYHGLMLLLYVFILVWSADSGAYFVGRKFGKHKLAPAYRQEKPRVFGGLVTAGVLATIFVQVARIIYLRW